MALREDPEFGPWVRVYAKDFDRLKRDFDTAFKWICEAGFEAPKEKRFFGKLVQSICTFKYDLPKYSNSCMSGIFGSLWDGFTESAANEPTKLAADAPKVGNAYTMEEIAKHNTADDLWVLINGVVCDVTQFKNDHPGGVDILMENGGKDASAMWNT